MSRLSEGIYEKKAIENNMMMGWLNVMIVLTEKSVKQSDLLSVTMFMND